MCVLRLFLDTLPFHSFTNPVRARLAYHCNEIEFPHKAADLLVVHGDAANLFKTHLDHQGTSLTPQSVEVLLDENKVVTAT
jgi:hypothetical protein